MTCDCTEIRANVAYSQAAVTYDNAAISLAQSELSADQTAYYSWLSQSYMCGCTAMARNPDGEDVENKPIDPFPVDESMMKRFAQEWSDMREKHLIQMLSNSK